MKRFKAAAYCRLSRDDENKQSESIANQRLLIEGYINRHSDEFELVEVYEDDGITGMTYDRAAYSRMMEAIDEGSINAIIVKDLSRIGREQIETLNLIKKEFILKNIRFIAINDDYDSFDSSKRDGLSTSVKLLLNDYYCADISKKVRSSQKAKRERGDFIGSHAPYGYVKDPQNKNRLVIDPAAAEVIQRIFSLYLSGHGKVSIARLLNKEGIPNPTVYKRTVLKQNYFNANRLSKTSCWTYSTINKILANRVYIGTMVQHRSEIKAYNIHKKVAVPKEDWCVVENTHEAIIEQSAFDSVQALLMTKTKTLEMTENLSKYTGLFFCKDCGRAMNKFLSKPRKDGSRYITFKCGSYSNLGKDICTIHSIKESDLDELVLGEIQRNIKLALDAKACEYIQSKAVNAIKSGNAKRLEKLQNDLEACYGQRKNMLVHLSQGVISSEDFRQFDADNKTETERLRQSIAQTEEKLADENSRINEYNSWLENILKYKDIKEVTREILVGLVDKIYISESENSKEVEIKFKFRNPLE